MGRLQSPGYLFKLVSRAGKEKHGRMDELLVRCLEQNVTFEIALAWERINSRNRCMVLNVDSHQGFSTHTAKTRIY